MAKLQASIIVSKKYPNMNEILLTAEKGHARGGRSTRKYSPNRTSRCCGFPRPAPPIPRSAPLPLIGDSACGPSTRHLQRPARTGVRTATVAPHSSSRRDAAPRHTFSQTSLVSRPSSTPDPSPHTHAHTHTPTTAAPRSGGGTPRSVSNQQISIGSPSRGGFYPSDVSTPDLLRPFPSQVPPSPIQASGKKAETVHRGLSRTYESWGSCVIRDRTKV